MTVKTIERVIISDGNPIELATAILLVGYGLPGTKDAAAAMAKALELPEKPIVHTTENAFSYPNAVALVRDSKGRKSLYLFDSDQEDLKDGGTLHEIDPDTPVMKAAPALGNGDDLPIKAAAPGSTAAANISKASEASHGSEPLAGDTSTTAPVPSAPVPQPAEPPAPPAFPEAVAQAVPGEHDAGLAGQAGASPDTPTEPVLSPSETPAPEPMPAEPPFVAETIGSGDVGKLPAGIVPGETAGYPADAVSGEPIKLSHEEHEKLAGVKIGDPDGTVGVGLGQGASSGPVAGIGQTGPDTAVDPEPETHREEVGEGKTDPGNGPLGLPVTDIAADARRAGIVPAGDLDEKSGESK